MPWGRIDDRLAMSVKIRGLADPGAPAERAKAQRCEALGLWTQVLSWVSGERSDGFVTLDIVQLFGRQEAVDRLLRAQYGRAPLLHRRDDAERCDCMDGRGWVDGYDFLVHDYLDRNPSRSENDVHVAKKRELKDQALKTRVAQRDANRCRYCGKECKPSDRRSDDGRTFDHVDPEVADGDANLVTACRGCNRRKGRRTPEAAGMVLLPIAGTETDAAAAAARPATATAAASSEGPEREEPQVTANREHRQSGSGSAPDLSPDSSPDSDPTQIRTQIRSRSDPDPDTGPDPGQRPDPDPGPGGSLGTDLRQNRGPAQNLGSPGTGRVGDGPARDPGPEPSSRPSTAVGPPDTDRRSRSTSPYLRVGPRDPDHYAGVPPDPSGSDP
jgi:5-methylcytosine-specific restriction endonuclease McrA